MWVSPQADEEAIVSLAIVGVYFILFNRAEMLEIRDIRIIFKSETSPKEW